MALRKKNLLDAFQAAAPEGRRAAEKNPSASAAGPFATPGATPGVSPGVTPRAAPLAFDSSAQPSLFVRAARDRAVRIAVVLGLVGLGLAYWVGTMNSGEGVQASQGAGEDAAPGAILNEAGGAAPAAVPDPVEANRQAAALSGHAHDKAFLDPQNKLTVRVKAFANDEAGRKAAFAARDYLRGEGLPVVQPVAKGKWILLCVGHEVKRADAEQLLEYVRALPGPKPVAKKPPYADAYIENIDNVVSRPKD